MNAHNLTLDELERAAYMSGNTALSNALGSAMEHEAHAEALQVEIDDTETLEQWEKRHGPADEYRQFFNQCFERLSGHYPCPSVTSDYDKNVIFEAIERGEGVNE
jgi:hypothetical protein